MRQGLRTSRPSRGLRDLSRGHIIAGTQATDHLAARIKQARHAGHAGRIDVHRGELVKDALQPLRQGIGKLWIGRFRHGFDDPHQVARHGLARLGRGRLVEASFGHMPRQPIKPQRSGQALERCGIGIEAFLVGVRGPCDGDHRQQHHRHQRRSPRPAVTARGHTPPPRILHRSPPASRPPPTPPRRCHARARAGPLPSAVARGSTAGRHAWRRHCRPR